MKMGIDISRYACIIEEDVRRRQPHIKENQDEGDSRTSSASSIRSAEIH